MYFLIAFLYISTLFKAIDVPNILIYFLLLKSGSFKITAKLTHWKPGR